MVAGAQTVHRFYKPLDDLDTFIKNFEEESSKVYQEQVKEAKDKVEKASEKK